MATPISTIPPTTAPTTGVVRRAWLKHGATCLVRASGGCQTCHRFWSMLHVHSRKCRVVKCTVPRCRELKEHLRRIQTINAARHRMKRNEKQRLCDDIECTATKSLDDVLRERENAARVTGTIIDVSH